MCLQGIGQLAHQPDKRLDLSRLPVLKNLPPDLFAKIEGGFMPGQMALERFADALELPLSALEHVSAEGEVTEKTSPGGL